MKVLTEELRLLAAREREAADMYQGQFAADHDRAADLLERAADRIEDLEREAVTDTQPELPL